VTSGTQVSSTVLGNDQVRHVWVTGPSREFVLHTSNQFESKAIETYGTNVTSYWLPGQEAVGRAALEHAVAALRIYSDYYGGYPFRDMRVAPAPLSYRGMEYPQVNLLGVDLYTRFQENLEVLVAHEAAHQWWYQIVHNDPVRAPWLDEALAEYSLKLYYEKLYGQEPAELLEWQRWETPVSLLAEQNNDMALGHPVDHFDTGTQYETIIYGKGALLYERLRNILGDRQFQRFLRDYLSRNRYEIVDAADWLEALQVFDDPEVDKLYQQWVQSPSEDDPAQEDGGTVHVEDSAE
jgi:aminopeptidase N